ncbi:MAG: hypothetical protein JNL08_09095 [Planctomycetes bacterium]|nr:hypothetical protein [Planctomycetota bacterium]
MNRRLVILPALALLVAGVVWWQRTPDAPAATWRIGTGTEIRQGRNFDALPAESPIRLSLHLAAPSHVYVFAYSREDGTVVLWPTPALQSDLPHPLPKGQSVLPGQHEGKELAWTTRAGIRAGTTYVVIAATAPVAELETLLPKLRHWSNTVFPDGAMLVTKPDGVEPIGGPLSAGFPSPLLERAARREPDRVIPNGPLQPDADLPGVFTGSWRIVETSPPPAQPR